MAFIFSMLNGLLDKGLFFDTCITVWSWLLSNFVSASA